MLITNRQVNASLERGRDKIPALFSKRNKPLRLILLTKEINQSNNRSISEI